MDQTASMLGREDHAVLLDCDDLESEVIPLGLDVDGLDAMVIDSRVEHAHATGGYADRREACERGAAAMGVASLRELTEDDLPRVEEAVDGPTFRRVRHIVTENARVAAAASVLATRGASAIGDLMLASHASMRDDFEISVPAIDAAVEAAMSAGAIGARLTGGGFGGASIALVPHARYDEIAEAVERALADGAFPTPRIFPVRPSDGARRDA
jgi:galactokinase